MNISLIVAIFDWFVRMSRVGKIGLIDRSLLKYRISDNQMSGAGNRVQIRLDIVQVIEKNIAIDPELYKPISANVSCFAGTSASVILLPPMHL